jgi:glycoprotein-N-acetylgalactosamine 3-beta-galactosyltransferase
MILKGGGGYILSNEAFNRLGSAISKNLTFCRLDGAEDVNVASCLRKLGVYPNKSIDDLGRERFHSLSIFDHYYGTYPDWLKSYAANPIQIVIHYFFTSTSSLKTKCPGYRLGRY